MEDKILVYWENQKRDKLCGLHCINSLLQFSYFDKNMLDEIALDVHESEQEIFKTGEVLKFDGNYKFQVLQNALSIYNVEVKILNSKEIKNDLINNMDAIEGLIINTGDHWFSIRKINNIFVNLNSTNIPEEPQLIDKETLKSFLNLSVSKNFIISEVKKIPNSQIPLQNVVKNDINKKIFYLENLKMNKELNYGNTDDRDVKEALKNSMNNLEINDFQDGDLNQLYEDEEIFLKESLNFYLNDLREKFKNEPDINKDNVIKVTINNFFDRNFYLNNTFDEVNDYINLQLSTNERYKIQCIIENKVKIVDKNKSILDNIENAKIKQLEISIIE